MHDPNNTRGLSLLNISFKVLSNLVLNRLQPRADEVTGEYQAGFRRGRSCTDHIHTLRTSLAARLWSTTLIFVDFQKAYDTVIREVLWERMRDMGIPHKLIRLAQIESRCIRSRVKTLGRLFQDFITRSGVQQGDAVSTLLFNLALEARPGSSSSQSSNLRLRRCGSLAHSCSTRRLASTRAACVEEVAWLDLSEAVSLPCPPHHDPCPVHLELKTPPPSRALPLHVSAPPPLTPPWPSHGRCRLQAVGLLV